MTWTNYKHPTEFKNILNKTENLSTTSTVDYDSGIKNSLPSRQQELDTDSTFFNILRSVAMNKL